MRNINVPQTVSPMTVLDFQVAIERGTNPASAFARLSQSAIVTTAPKWAIAAAMWSWSGGKHGFHALHMVDGLLSDMIADSNNEQDMLDLIALALAHPNNANASDARTLARIKLGKKFATEWPKLQKRDLPSASRIRDLVYAYIENNAQIVQQVAETSGATA